MINNQINPESTVLECYESLKKFHSWNIWNSASGTVVIQIVLDESHNNRETFSGASIADALSQALAYRPLKKIPPRPSLICLEEWEPRKRNNRYWDSCNRNTGEEVNFGCRTKAECSDAMSRLCDRHKKAREAWDMAFSHAVDGQNCIITNQVGFDPGAVTGPVDLPVPTTSDTREGAAQ